MKLKIALLAALSVCCLAQQIAPNPTQTFGTNAPDPGRCNDQVNLSSTYTQVGDPANAFAGQYICLQSGPRSFGWAAVEVLAPGTTGTTGYAIISDGKVLRVINTLKFIGTDGTTVYFPTTGGSLPVFTFCGATSGNANCANTSGGLTAKVVGGIATLSSNSAVISNLNFTSTATYSCTTVDQTTITNPTKVANTSATSITITDTTGASDAVSYVCIGY